ncbi:MAG TPA: hypothetical protein VE093_41200 [Polyangiaceae bacterium]|nr:hypothetical protein [Polyangiaceae bacterium]
MSPWISSERSPRARKGALLSAALGLFALTGSADAQQPGPPPPPPGAQPTAPTATAAAPVPPPPPPPGAQPPPDAAGQPPGYPPGYPPPAGSYPPGYAPYGPYGYPYGYPYDPAYYPDPTPRPPPTRRANGTLMAVGIGMVGVGAVGVLSGLAAFATANNRIDVYGDGGQRIGTRDDEDLQVAAAVLTISSAVVGVAGIPLWVIGGKRVPLEGSEKNDPAAPGETQQKPGPAQPPPPPSPAATLRIVPGGASLTVTF